MRILFMGTPEFAVPVLEALIDAGYEIVAAVSQPDREKDKKGNIIPTAVKACAEKHGIKCLQFDKVSAHVSELAALKPDVAVTAAFGQILSAEAIAAPELGILNVHASLLPKFRGSSPVQTALMCGEKTTGVTIMKTDIGMDTGDMIAKADMEISEDDNCATLTEKLSRLGAELLVRTLGDYASGKIEPEPQNGDDATYCKKVVKADGNVNWNESAEKIACLVRAYNPWPTAYTYLDGELLKIYSARVKEEKFGAAGEIRITPDEMTVSCGEGSLALETVQLQGKKAMPISDFLRGKKLRSGNILTNE